jgi:putative integral membrane protein (TIGR02587 family)
VPGDTFLVGLARAFGGAILFALPLLMTMEMWSLGFYMDRLRLALFMALMVPLLVGLSHYAGFKPTATWTDDVADAFVAYGVAFVASLLVLALFRVVTLSMPPGEIVGKVALQAVPGGFGAMLARSQFSESESDEEARRNRGGYGMEMLLMAGGAVFLAFNVAPTEEMVLIAYMMTPWHALAVALVSLGLMHGFVYASGFAGSADHRPEGVPAWSLFLRFTVVGYAIALLVSAYVLWTFGRSDEHFAGVYMMMVVVLGFPASIGAAAARLIL